MFRKKYKIILISDNHGVEEPLKYVLKNHSDADYFLHCGDVDLPNDRVSDFIVVEGNNDRANAFPLSRILRIGKYYIYMTHGHHDMFYGRYDMLSAKAKKNNCQVAICGHSHVPFAEWVDGVLCLNPGSCWMNRDNSEPSYMIITIDDEIHWEIKRFKKI